MQKAKGDSIPAFFLNLTNMSFKCTTAYIIVISEMAALEIDSVNDFEMVDL